MNNSPLVSICIPTLNGSEYLLDCLTSIEKQTYGNIEIVFSDDGSEDDTLSIINKFMETSPLNCHLFMNNGKQGIGGNWNNCVLNAKGKYIKFVFQDDLITESCIEEMVKIAESHSNVGLVYCQRELILPSNFDNGTWLNLHETLHNSWAKMSITTGVLSGKMYLNDPNIMEQPLNKIGEPSAVLILKSCFDEIGYFETQLEQLLDAEFWYRIMTKFDIAFLDKKLCSFRIHHKQASEVNKTRPVIDYEIWPRIFYSKFQPFLCKKLKTELNNQFHPIYKRFYWLKSRFNS
jgi:glycosyltransferase involved in cell wall biosynthesis